MSAGGVDAVVRGGGASTADGGRRAPETGGRRRAGGRAGRLAAGGGRARDAAAAEVLAALVPDLDLEGPTLVVDDVAGAVESAVRARAPVAAWRRRALDGAAAAPWAPDGPFAAALVRLPRERAALEMVLHAVAARLAPGGRLWLCGANDEGIRSAPRRLAPLFTDARPVDARRHCRVIAAIRTDAPARGGLEDWRLDFTVDLPDGPLRLVTWPAVFAGPRLDEGTALLLDALPPAPAGARILDFGCGNGVVSAVIRRRAAGAVPIESPSGDPRAKEGPAPSKRCGDGGAEGDSLARDRGGARAGDRLRMPVIEGVDVDALAVEAARRNVPGARFHLADGWPPGPAGPYDLIVSNPPIHRGKVEDLGVLRRLVAEAPARLAPGGALVLVVQRQVPVERLMKAAFGRVALRRETTRFRVWEARG